MALWKKLALWTLVLLLLVVAAGIQAVVGWRALVFGPAARALTSRTFEATPERLERGRYLAMARHGCVFCHSERDWNAPGAPPRADRLGAGVVWTAEGMPWLTAPNLTPDPETGIGKASDDAVSRAIREGIGLDGRALFALMPYQEYRRLPDEDLAAIVVYLRSLPPVKNPLPKSTLPFPLSLIMRGVPQPLTAPVPAPDLSTPEKRGEYVLRTAACHQCHTPMDAQGHLDMRLDMAGGNPFPSPQGTIAATNLTLDPTGIANYDEATFVTVMKTGKFGTLHAMMPWTAYSRMTDEDLTAIYAYLRTLKPVSHVVANGPNPTPCRLCGKPHGGGEKNGS
jgi:mono/diheme cytochrome c family protein